MEKIKFTQITATSDDSGVILYGLDRLGRVWVTYSEGSEWKRLELPDAPEEDSEITTIRV